MEPMLPSPQNPENTGPPPLEKVAPSSVESRPNTSVEQPREMGHQGTPPQQVAPIDDAAQSVVPAPTLSSFDDGSGGGPIAADDADVIEKEWVDKAKKIVGATKDDPHQQEKEVSKLQADYLMKRYGKQMKLSE